ncbi:hypothetical protein SIO70_11295 [Chitinophaga sancti]|uniref:hypothetical protein n=1 Tax=Chitinophaga sancti TaxID=1004 RepID=UPI002A748C71|nr:hypothetical protein [Chitinophaga sancti]WPQ65432.1 hypothetical protein SIO70_11295 [Chitinophaga sancti]
MSHPFNFKRAIYAYSGVSGGSLGIAFFNAMAYLTPDSLHKVDSLTNMTDLFFQQDYLSPVIGKMFYGDLLNLLLPFQIPAFDRAAADELRHYIEDELQGKVIQLSIGKSGSQVPLNWGLSTNSLNNLKMDIKDKWEHREFNDLRNLYILNKDVKWDY